VRGFSPRRAWAAADAVLVVTDAELDPGSRRRLPASYAWTGVAEPPPRALPHAEVLPRCALVVGHGGHSTTMRALLHGLPLVVLPADPRVDQPSVGRAVQRAGAGLLLDPASPPERIRRAVTTVLGDPAYRAAADDVGRRLRAQDGIRAAADAVEQLAR
jgi:UDP:flavonoid glycosyltransferase YjiC (YdhE family)